MRDVDLPEVSLRMPLRGIPGWTQPHEVKLVRWLAGLTAGGIVEIGCNNGQTTFELASEFPERPVVAVDWVDGLTMCDGQKGERPPEAQLCAQARHLPNVTVLNINSRELDYAALGLPETGFVFIDGDHSYEGVKADTEKALGWLEQEMAGVERPVFPSIIAWHDAEDGAPDWVGVARYLRDLAAREPIDIVRVRGTWVAAAVLGARWEDITQG